MGKTLADLQSNISISALNAVTGDIEFCSGYTGFSDDVGELSGWYLALKVSPSVEGSALEGATITATYAGTVRTLADGETFIIRLAEGEDSITFTANKEGYIEGRLTLDLSGLTLKPIPQTLTISIPENNELVAEVLNDSTKQALTSYFFAPSSDLKITTIKNVSSDGKSMSIGASSGLDEGSRRLYSMTTLKPLNGEGNTTMSGTIIPIKITRLDSTNTVKFRKGNNDHTNRNVVFDLNNIGYILCGTIWNNDWPFYIDVYNSSNELIDTYTINLLGYAQSYNWSTSPISDFSSGGAYYQLALSTLADDTDIVPNIEDASGNPVSVATFHENLTLPSRLPSYNVQFASGTVHYVQGLKYSDTLTALADGYYMIMKVPAYSGTQGNQISKMRSNLFGNSTGRQDYTIPTTDKILMPIPWGTDVNSGALTTEIFPYFYETKTLVSYYNLHLLPNLTIDPPLSPAENFVNNGSAITLNNTDVLYKDAASTGTDTFQAGLYITSSTTNSSGSSYSGTSSAPYRVDVYVNPVATDTWTAGFVITNGTNGNPPVIETGTTGTLSNWSVKMASDNKTITLTYHDTTPATAKVYYNQSGGGTKHVLINISQAT